MSTLVSEMSLSSKSSSIAPAPSFDNDVPVKALLNIPFIAIPLPTSKDNHQFENAKFYEDKNTCWLIEQHSFEEKIDEYLKDIFEKKSDYLEKKENLKKLNFQNTWINVNQKLLKIINEN